MYAKAIIFTFALLSNLVSAKCPNACTNANNNCFANLECASLWATVIQTETVHDTVTNTVTDTVHDTVTNTVTDTVHDTVTNTVTDTVHDTVTDTITETIHDTETETIHDTITDIITNTETESVTQTVHDTMTETATIFTSTITRPINRPTVTKSVTATVTSTSTYSVPCSPMKLACGEKLTGGVCNPTVDHPRCSGKQIAICRASTSNPVVGTWRFTNCAGVTVCAATSNSYKCVVPEFSQCDTGSFV